MSALHKIAVLAYEGLCTFEFGIVELFGLPRPELGALVHLRGLRVGKTAHYALPEA